MHSRCSQYNTHEHQQNLKYYEDKILVDKPAKSDILNAHRCIRKETVWNYSFVFTRFFRKCELDITNISGGSFLENEKENGFL